MSEDSQQPELTRPSYLEIWAGRKPENRPQPGIRDGIWVVKTRELNELTEKCTRLRRLSFDFQHGLARHLSTDFFHPDNVIIISAIMQSGQQPYWFRAKRYGWGWGLPLNWQGWVVLVPRVAIVTTVSPMLAIHSTLLFALFIALMVGVLLEICYAKGEPPKWRWG